MENNQLDKKYIYKLYGHEDSEEGHIYFPSEKVLSELEEISDLDRWDQPPIIKLRPSKKSIIEEGAKKFYRRHLKLHSVPYKGLLRGLDLHIMCHVDNVELAAKMCNALNIYVNPFRIPVKYIGLDGFDTMTITNADFIDDPDFFNLVDISYKKIILGREVTELTESDYVHEVAHTQLTKTKGMVRQYANSEVIPIFLELVDLFESESEDLRLLGDLQRLNELISHINTLHKAAMGESDKTRDDLINSTVYAESILKAYQLLIKYINGNYVTRKYIFMYIQHVINGQRQLEEMLDKFEITTESVVEDRKLFKYFNGERNPKRFM